jgi:hypothetical protein
MSDERLKLLWDEYCDQVWERLIAGRREYGDVSFERPLDALREERDQEWLDGAGWSFVAWVKMRSAGRNGTVQRDL